MTARIVHLLSGDLWAGAEVATFHLLEGLRNRADVSVEALVLNEGELSRRLRESGVPTKVIPENGRSYRALLQAVRGSAHGADLVHAHRYKEDLLAAFSGIPWVATQHGRPEPLEGAAAARMAVYQTLDLAAKRLSAQQVIAVSTELGDWLSRWLPGVRVAVAWNGMADPRRGTGIIPWPDRPRRVGVLARLVPVKKLELAIDAVAACEGVELEIIGDGPCRSALSERARASGANGRIRFLGHVPDPIPLVGQWRALLVTSLHEGNPMSVIEALAMGTPVISAELPGVVEMLGKCGDWIVRSRDPAVWRAAIAQLLSQADIGERASRMARVRFEEAFTRDRAASRVAEIYHRVLSKQPYARL